MTVFWETLGEEDVDDGFDAVVTTIFSEAVEDLNAVVSIDDETDVGKSSVIPMLLLSSSDHGLGTIWKLKKERPPHPHITFQSS